MNACQPMERPDYRKYRLLREALVDVRALVPEDVGPDGRPVAKAAEPAQPADENWNAGLRLDGIANLAVLCAGVAVVVIAAAHAGLAVPFPGLV